MKSERILYALTGARDDFVERAEPERAGTRRAWVKHAAAAACLCAVAAGVLALALGQREKALPLIDIPEFLTHGGGDGVHNIDDRRYYDDTPWTADMELSAMPVFKNGAFDPSLAGEPCGLSGRQMKKRLKKAAEALGLEIYETETWTSNSSGEAMYIIARTDNGRLEVRADGTVCWDADWNGEGVPLPEEYAFPESESTTQGERERIEYLARLYSELLGFEQPATALEDYGYTRRIAYDAAGDDVSDILNYYFESASFSVSEDGAYLTGIYADDKLSVLEKIGDYPIISIDGAVERLLAGQYQTNCPLKVPGAEYIMTVELTYRDSPLEEIIMPYYLFRVEMRPDGDYLHEGERGFGYFYVPAIESEYIGSMAACHGPFD